MEKDNLKKAILRTLTYFDLNDYPLTSTEIKNWLYRCMVVDLDDLLSVLQELKNQNKIEEKFSFFYLFGREKTVENRQRNLVISELKLKKARQAIKFIRWIPFLKAVFVCNTVASGTAVKESDIDFFVIAGAKRIWLVRFFTNLILRVFGLRTYGNENSDKICLSFFVDEENLNLEKLKAIDNDIHFAYWITQMVPIYDSDNFWKRFVSANYWLKDYFPNFINSYLFSTLVDRGNVSRFWKNIWEVMWFGSYGDLIEKQSREWQMLKMKSVIKEKSKRNDNGVILNDGVIKLHENDTRRDCALQWEERLRSILN